LVSTIVEAPIRTDPSVDEQRNPDTDDRSDAGTTYGPLLAVCGLAGGCGATTLAYLIALAAAQARGRPVLVADMGGASGGLAARAGVETVHSLPALAAQLDAGAAIGSGLYAIGEAGVRVLAAGPEFTTTCARASVARLLLDAREAHRLTVVDCGTLAREPDRMAAAAATHLAWVMPAHGDGLSRAGRVLEAAPAMAGKALMVASAQFGSTKTHVRELRRLADDRRAPLVLMPRLSSLDDGRLDGAINAAQVPLHAILGALRR
jgi:hypothetical protein